MVKKLEFRISSGLKDIIGKELITEDRIAIFELVKNSYDANASRTKITFQNITDETSKQPRIIVTDDGDGMSYDDIVNKFLFVGYSEKKPDEAGKKDFRDKISERRKRHFAGSKGIGRFSCDRLGKQLKIYTKVEAEKDIHTLTIDWTKFEQDQEEEFDTVTATYEKVNSLDIQDCPIKNFKKGTILVVTQLNSVWDYNKLLWLKRFLQRLINPMQVDADIGFKIYLEANEYREQDQDHLEKEEPWNVINGPIQNIVIEKMEMKTTRVTSEISEDGKEIHTELYDKDRVIFRLKEKNTYSQLKNTKAIVFFMNSLAKRTFTAAMGLEPVNYGSVFLYKNGIRIYPYGDPGEDWLGLDRLKQQGYARYLGTREVIGRVEVTGGQPGFIEVSSRDGGLLKNECYEELIDFIVKKVVMILRRYVVEGLDWDRDADIGVVSDDKMAESIHVIERLIGSVKDKDKDVEFNPDLLNIFKETETERLPEVIKNVEAIKKHIKDPEAKKYIDRQVKAIRKTTHAIKKKAGETEKELKVIKRKNLFLEKAADQDSEVVMSLNHSIKITTFSIESSIEEINELIENNEPIEKIAPLLDEIDLENKKIQSYASYVSLATFDTRIETIDEDVVTFISEYLRYIVKKRLRKLAMRINGEGAEFKRKFKPLEFSIVIDNLMDNSVKAKATMISASFEKNGKKLIFRISDNGKGIQKDEEGHIFDRGFSSTGGSGTGLYHVKKLLEGINADINFIGNNVEGHEKGACFEVMFS